MRILRYPEFLLLMSDLQFDKAEPEGPQQAGPGAVGSPQSCAACQQSLTDEYYEANGKTLCPKCRAGLDQLQRHSLPAATGLAFLRGGLTAMVCAGVDAAIMHFTGYSLGLVWIFCGLFIGAAVNTGSEGRGGWLFKLMALFLTYAAMGLSLALVSLASLSSSGALEKVIVFVIALLVGPVVACFTSPMMLIIYGIGFYNAWKAVQKVQIDVTGPYKLKPVEHQPEPAPLP